MPITTRFVAVAAGTVGIGALLSGCAPKEKPVQLPMVRPGEQPVARAGEKDPHAPPRDPVTLPPGYPTGSKK